MGPRIQILILEDNEPDAELMERQLRKAGFDFKAECVHDKDAFLQALDRFTPDIILADYSLPGFDGMAALALAREKNKEVPVVIVSGTIGEEFAIETLKAGATDYVLKQRLFRLGPVVRRALQEAVQTAERRRAEQEALQAKREWERTFDAVPDLIAILDERHRILRVNRAMAERLGTTPDRCLGKFCHEAVHGLDQPPDFCPHALTLADGREHGVEMWEARLGGEFLVTTTPLADEGGRRIGSVHVARDLGERRRSEEALRQSESRYRSLFEGMTEGFALHEILCDEKGNPRDYRFLEINPAFERLTGLKRENLIGKTVREALPGTESLWIEKYGRVALTGEPVHFESYTAALKRHYEVYAYSPAPRQFGVLFLDITERKRAEARLKANLEALTQMHLLSGKLLEAEGPQPLLQDIMSSAVAIMGASQGTLQLLEGGSLRIVAHHGHRQPFLEFFASAETRASACGEAMTCGRRVVVPDIETSPLFAGTPSLPVMREAGVRSAQSTPLVSRQGALLGILTTQWSVPHSPDEHDLWRIDLLARQAADLIEVSRAEEGLRRSQRLSASLNRISETIHAALDPEEILHRLVTEGASGLGCDSAGVSLRDGGGWVVSHVHALPESLVGARMNDDEERHAVLAYESREAVPVEDAFNDPRFNREHLRRHNIRAVLVAPLVAGDRGFGVIFFNYHGGPRKFSDAEINFARQLGATACIAFANAQLLEERKRAEEALMRAKDELETRVRERTEELAKSQGRLQQLSSRLLRAQEAERKRVAVEVHDGLLSELAAMKFLVEGRLSLLEKGKPLDPGEFRKISAILAAVMKEARGIMNGLHPSILDDLGLIAALGWLSGEYEKSYPHIKVRTRIEVSERDISDSLKPVIFRVSQEALNNFAKHGKGDRVDLAITKAGHALAFQIRDNGQGFDVENAPKGLGLESMRERVQMSGGEFQIESAPGQGTAIRATWNRS